MNEREGSSLSMLRALLLDPHGIRQGAFDSDLGVRPGFHQFVTYTAKWERIPDDGLPRPAEWRPA